MIDSTAIQMRADDRASIAQAMADYERQNGPVKTLAIRIDDKQIPFSISSAERRQVASEAIRQGDRKAATRRAALKSKGQRTLEIVRTMAASGAKIVDIAEAANIKPGSVMNLIRNHHIQRGPKIDLQS